MKIKNNQVVRIGAKSNVPLRYWGRLAKVQGVVMKRNALGEFARVEYLVKPTNRKSPMSITKNKLIKKSL